MHINVTSSKKTSVQRDRHPSPGGGQLGGGPAQHREGTTMPPELCHHNPRGPPRSRSFFQSQKSVPSKINHPGCGLSGSVR